MPTAEPNVTFRQKPWNQTLITVSICVCRCTIRIGNDDGIRRSPISADNEWPPQCSPKTVY